MPLTLVTCDHSEGFCRAAVWREGKLCDLYVNKVDDPDPSGAVVRAKALRITAGGRSAWFDGGLQEKIYVENTENIRAGDICLLSVRTTRGQGKASTGVILEDKEKNSAVGLVTPPPAPWQRALEDFKDEDTLCRFSSREDWTACRNYLGSRQNVRMEEFSSQAVHPHLDEMIDVLLQPRISLPGGGDIVIELTEALVAIDVNSGDASNAPAANMIAMREIARQIRLRNLGGIIVIDALKMKERTDKAKMLAALSVACASDPAGAEVFGLTKLGLVEMTRTRRGPSLADMLKK